MFEANLVYRMSSKTPKATQRNPVSKKKSEEKKDKKKFSSMNKGASVQLFKFG